MTEAEAKLWSRLRDKQIGYYFRRETPIGRYIVDFLCWKQRLVVEVDGSQHYTEKGRQYDRKRDQFLGQQGFRVLRFSSSEVLNNTDGVLNTILEYIQEPPVVPL